MDGGYGGWGRQGNQKYSGRIMVRDRDTLFGYGRAEYFNDFTSAPQLGRYRDQDLYRLYAASITAENSDAASPQSTRREKQAQPAGPKYTWTADVPIYVRAMVLAENGLFIAGPKHILKDETADVPRVLEEQVALLQGAGPAELHAVSRDAGDRIGTETLSSPPVFDGMIAADGKVLVCTTSNTLICLEP
jgi:hypothetical protein